MIYRFTIGSEEAEYFKLEIAIDAGDTFMRLRNAILEAAGYSKEQMNSFYVCDEDWNKEKEITYMDMGSDTDEDIWLMEETPLDELIEEEGQRMKFVFDYMTDRYFYIRLKETLPGKTLRDPLCERKEGKPPRESIDIDTFVPVVPKVDTTVDELGEQFYGDEDFNEEELSEYDQIDESEL